MKNITETFNNNRETSVSPLITRRNTLHNHWRRAFAALKFPVSAHMVACVVRVRSFKYNSRAHGYTSVKVQGHAELWCTFAWRHHIESRFQWETHGYFIRWDAYLRKIGVVAYLSVHGHMTGVDSRRRDDERRGEQERQHRPCGNYQAHERQFTNSLTRG